MTRWVMLSEGSSSEDGTTDTHAIRALEVANGHLYQVESSRSNRQGAPSIYWHSPVFVPDPIVELPPLRVELIDPPSYAEDAAPREPRPPEHLRRFVWAARHRIAIAIERVRDRLLEPTDR